MATSINEIRNRITADNQTSAAFTAAGKDATKFSAKTVVASERAQRAMRGVGIAIAATAAAAVAAVAGSFRLTQGMAQTEDQAGKTANMLGLSVEALTRMQHVAGLTGVNITTMNTAMQRQARRVSEAAKGTGEAVAAIAELGIEAKALAALAPDQQFLRIAQSMEKIPAPGDRIRLAMKLWDTEGVKLVTTINAGSEAIAVMMAESDLLGATITGETAASAAAFNDELLRLEATITGMTRLLTNELKPIFTVIFREAKVAMLGNRDAAEDFAAAIQDKVIAGLRIGLEVMRFFHNGWLGIKLVGSAALAAIATGVEMQTQLMRVLLFPLDAIFEGLVALGTIDVNPFDTLQNGLADFQAASVDQTKQVISDIEATNAAYDSVGQTIDTLNAKINEQRRLNTEAGEDLSGENDPRVERELITQEELARIRHEAMLQGIAADQALDDNLSRIHADQVARKKAEISIEAQLGTARRAQISGLLGNIAKAAQASNASFNTQKNISIAQALVGTYQASVDAYRSAGNPFLGAVLASVAFAANIAQVNAIRRTRPGGGGGGAVANFGTPPSSAAGGVPATGAAPATAPGGTQPPKFEQTIIFKVAGDSLDNEGLVRKLGPAFQKFARDGGFVTVGGQRT